jgi:hypothetical protein
MYHVAPVTRSSPYLFDHAIRYVNQHSAGAVLMASLKLHEIRDGEALGISIDCYVVWVAQEDQICVGALFIV